MPDLTSAAELETQALPAEVLASVAAALWPSLSPADRREKAREALGLRPLAPWTENRMVYIERQG